MGLRSAKCRQWNCWQMHSVTHLKSLQALEMAMREGSLQAAAKRLGITPAAVGQRIRLLEDRLGTVLLTRGPSGLTPSSELALALADLREGFAALEKANDALDFSRASEIHVVADPDWAELWLIPRIKEFRAVHAHIRFCINGEGDVPIRIGAPDLRISRESDDGEVLYRDVFLPVTGPDNTRRTVGRDPTQRLEGMPLLHMRPQRDGNMPGWVEWSQRFGHRERGADRGVVYPNARLALPAARRDVGFLICNLSFVLEDISAGSVVLPFAAALHLPASRPYRMFLRPGSDRRPQTARFLNWLRQEARQTEAQMSALIGQASA
jgi:LysR family glycine cleavage system transcriptional activator